MRAKGVPDPVVSKQHVKRMLRAFPYLRDANLGELATSGEGAERILRDVVLAHACVPHVASHRQIDEEQGRRVLEEVLRDIDSYWSKVTGFE